MDSEDLVNEEGGKIIRDPAINNVKYNIEEENFLKEENRIKISREDELSLTEDGELSLTEDGELLKNYLEWEGFAQTHVEVYDRWIQYTAKITISSRLLEFPDGRKVCFENLQILHPRYTREGKGLPMTPKLAREQGVTYGGDWYVDVVLKKNSCEGQELDRKTHICIGKIPTMLKSQNCILKGKNEEELGLLGEDPNDPPGYMIVAGVEKICLLQEQLVLNKIFLMKE